MISVHVIFDPNVLTGNVGFMNCTFSAFYSYLDDLVDLWNSTLMALFIYEREKNGHLNDLVHL